ncbi:MAG: endopeptidase La [Bacteroidota bacterium]|nr:endopeptidase La [Bacteroidota bacterium]
MADNQVIKSETSISSTEKIPPTLPVLPLRDVVIFPYMIFPVLVGRESSLRAANYALDNNKFIFLVSQKDPVVEDPGKDDIYTEGTVARIVQILKLPNNLMKILVDGVVQGTITHFHENDKFLEADVQVTTQSADNSTEMDAIVRHASSLFSEYVRANRNIPPEVLAAFENIKDVQRRHYYISANILQTVEVKQKILRLANPKEQYLEIIRVLNSEINILKIEREIDTKVHENIQKSQRKYFIQEQIKILQDELGEEESTPELVKLKDDIAKSGMPKEAMDKALEEFGKLRKTPSMSPEFGVLRNYLDWLVSLPWKKKTKDDLNIEHVKTILDEDHYGLEKPKERILEHIAVLNLVKEMKGQILCLVGPPGVGKTSLAESIARAMGRKLVRMSLGGVRDEAEIRGHRRTYIGSMPGKIIQSMKRAGVVNPVMLMDEIDKMSMDFRGDPASALLEVLDPQQNMAFNDHYLEIDYDLSKVMFITTANVRYAIPHPLLDRMEVIELSSYLDFEKKEIAERHIIPRQIKDHGLTNSDVNITSEAIQKIIVEYTRESGVRNLEREIASVCRKAAKETVLARTKNGSKKGKPKHAVLVIDAKKVEEYLGVPKFHSRAADKEAQVGSVTGLAWTSVGGDILHVDVTLMKGPGRLTLTGQLGDVMKESAQAALSYIRSNAKTLKLNPEFFTKKEIHIHLPEGAIPKDGPSAGITMTMAMISAISGKPARADVAMTGEITLRGEVLPIGGLNEKLLAAKRAGIKTVLIPKENQKDLTEIKESVKEGLKIIPVEKIEEALPYVFGKSEKKQRK